jgi:glutamine synthetase
MSEISIFKKSVASELERGESISSHVRDYNSVLAPGQDHLLDLSYIELEEKNLEAKKDRVNGVTSGSVREKYLSYLEQEKGIKAVTVCFTDLEGRFHALDYDKKHILRSEDNLTFDGSSIKGFTAQAESDLRLNVDWTSFRWVPSDLFGKGKVLVFANVCDKDGSLYVSDFRSRLYELSSELREKKGITVNVAPEVEGFIFKGSRAEQTFDEKRGFELATMSGYFSSLPHDVLRIFIDKFAEAQRCLGFENEKDHPEVAPAQFELNFKYSVALDSADQIQLYKLLARQVASSMGLTASFLPKPVQGLNGSGMHTNISFSQNGRNIFYDGNGENSLSEDARRFITGVLHYANDLCLVMNPSVNAYRRLDPAYEAPNEIKVSSVDRGSMIRIPLGNENSARVEVRTVAPDVNPYLCIYAILSAGLKGMSFNDSELKDSEDGLYSGSVKKLPGDIYSAIGYFVESDFMKATMGELTHKKYAELKLKASDRCPRALGKNVKSGEVLYHHEITNQLLWSDF